MNFKTFALLFLVFACFLFQASGNERFLSVEEDEDEDAHPIKKILDKKPSNYGDTKNAPTKFDNQSDDDDDENKPAQGSPAGSNFGDTKNAPTKFDNESDDGDDDDNNSNENKPVVDSFDNNDDAGNDDDSGNDAGDNDDGADDDGNAGVDNPDYD